MTTKRYFFLVLILGSLTALSPFSIDMYLPGFEAIAKNLHTTVEHVALSLSSYFIGLAFGQLLYGPLLDKYGRKKPLYAGLFIYILASCGCMFAGTINMLIGLRFVQAIGGCAASVAAMAMVRDIFPLHENARVFALLMLVLGVSPMLAPTIGGYITASLGWHIIFLALALIAVIILAAVIWILPDAYKPNKGLSLKPLPILNGFWDVLKVPQFYTYAMAGSIAFAGLFTYVSAAPIIFMKLYHVDVKTFGWIFAGLSVGFIGAGQLNNLLLKKYRSEQMIPFILIVQLIGACAFFGGAVIHVAGLPYIIVTVFIQLCGVGMALPNTSALCIAPFSRNAGTAAALMGFLQLGIGSLASSAVGALNVTDPLPIAGIMLAAGLLACMVYFMGRRFIIEHVAATEGVVAAH